MFKSLFRSNSSAAAVESSASDSAHTPLRELIDQMCQALVDEPSKIDIKLAEENPESMIFELRVAKPDLGKVIGKKGRTASAMRTILSAASRKYRMDADLRIVE